MDALDRIKRELRILTWMAAANTILLLAVLVVMARP